MAARSWILDFEGYTEQGGKFWVKELCILPCDTLGDDECYNYFIKSDDMTKTGCYFWQFRRHALYKDFGDYYFGEAIRDVQIKIGDGKVLVKGREKANFLREWFKVEELLEQLCSFKKSGGQVLSGSALKNKLCTQKDFSTQR